MSIEKSFMLGLFVAFLVFLVREHKMIKTFINKSINKKENIDLSNRLKEHMKNKGLSYEDAKQELITEELVKALNVSKDYLQLNRDIVLYQGDRVSFVDKEVGFLRGRFIGVIESEIVGYEDLYVLYDDRDIAPRQASISCIKVDTINVYK